MRFHSWWITATLALGVSCGSSTAVCVSPPVLPLLIHARSSTTGESLDATATLTIFAVEAPFDTVTGPLNSNPPSLPLAHFADRSGSFHVHISVPGFVPFDQVTVVERDNCNEPKTVSIVAILTSSPMRGQSGRESLGS
jgi:hypothetical protein